MVYYQLSVSPAFLYSLVYNITIEGRVLSLKQGLLLRFGHVSPDHHGPVLLSDLAHELLHPFRRPRVLEHILEPLLHYLGVDALPLADNSVLRQGGYRGEAVPELVGYRVAVYVDGGYAVEDGVHHGEGEHALVDVDVREEEVEHPRLLGVVLGGAQHEPARARRGVEYPQGLSLQVVLDTEGHRGHCVGDVVGCEELPRVEAEFPVLLEVLAEHVPEGTSLVVLSVDHEKFS